MKIYHFMKISICEFIQFNEDIPFNVETILRSYNLYKAKPLYQAINIVLQNAKFTKNGFWHLRSWEKIGSELVTWVYADTRGFSQRYGFVRLLHNLAILFYSLEIQPHYMSPIQTIIGPQLE